MEDTVVGSTRKRRFLITLLGGFIIFSSLLATIGFTGTIFALPLGGMGDFYVTFEELEGEEFTLNPQIGETGEQDEAPLVRNEIGTATIDDLHIYKDLKLPTGKWVRINVKADQPSKIEGLTQDARFIDADLAFDEMAIKEENTSSMPVEKAFEKNWTQDADNVQISDAKIVTDYLFQNMVTLNGAKIYLERIDEPDKSDDGNISSDHDHNGRKSDSDSSATGVNNNNDNDGGGGGILPDTASNWALPIVIGVVLVLIGTVLLLRKKRKQLTEES